MPISIVPLAVAASPVGPGYVSLISTFTRAICVVCL
jgi:hypothetical protein